MGTMTQYARDFVAAHPGCTREEVKVALSNHPRVKAKGVSLPQLFWDLIRAGDIQERNSQLFPSERVLDEFLAKSGA